jgi:phosphoenolpyruvate-protein kinase (PTS system EI component)|tara:strand:+ start:288 stop:500 length:213 start_codon:yes stop_codon:yes gene_type:complete
MNALIHLVLVIVLKFLSNGTNDPYLTQYKFNHVVKENKNQTYQLKDLKPHYLITKEEVNKFSNYQLKRNT